MKKLFTVAFLSLSLFISPLAHADKTVTVGDKEVTIKVETKSPDPANPPVSDVTVTVKDKKKK